MELHLQHAACNALPSLHNYKSPRAIAGTKAINPSCDVQKLKSVMGIAYDMRLISWIKC